jgi:hypothetical protein
MKPPLTIAQGCSVTLGPSKTIEGTRISFTKIDLFAASMSTRPARIKLIRQNLVRGDLRKIVR